MTEPQITVEEFEARFRDIERIEIIVRLNRLTLVDDYPRKIASPHNWTIAQLRDNNVLQCLQRGTEVIIGALGNGHGPNTHIGKLR